MYKSVLFTFAGLFFAVAAQAGSNDFLMCYEKDYRQGELPVFIGLIQSGNALYALQFNFKNPLLKKYFFDEIKKSGEITETHSWLENPAEAIIPEETSSNRSPYKGNNQYKFIFGHYRQLAGDEIYRTGHYDAWIYMPKDLSPEALEKFRFKNRPSSERSNAVLIYSAPVPSSQVGENYIRLFCLVK